MQEPLLIEPAVEPPLGVLLVEDNPADARLVEEELRHQDELSLFWVRSLGEAREALAARRYDAVLLDLLLPDAAGVDLIDGMRGVAGDAALVVLSGQSPDDLLLARAAIRKGAEDFLPKGARAPHLLPRMITTAVERRRRAAATPTPPAPLGNATGGDAVWRYCPDSSAVALAPAAARLLRLEAAASELSPATLLAALPGPARRAVLRLWCRLRAGALEATTLLFDNAPPRPGAAAQDTLLQARASRDDQGRIALVEGVLLDVTGARRIDRLHDAIVNQIGHELRTPLTTIRAALGLLHGGIGEPLPHGSAGLLGRAVQNADRLAQIVDELSDLQRGGTQPQRCPARRTDLAALARLLTLAVEAWRPRAAAAGVALLFRALPVAGSCGRDEPSDLAFALDAILADAVNRALPSGRVEVGLEPRDGWIWMTMTMTITRASQNAPTGQPEGRAMAAGASPCCCALEGHRLALIERLIDAVGGRLVEAPDATGGAWRIALPAEAGLLPAGADA